MSYRPLITLMEARCARCGARPDTVDPLPPGWGWDTVEPSNIWLICPDMLSDEGCPKMRGHKKSGGAYR